MIYTILAFPTAYLWHLITVLRRAKRLRPSDVGVTTRLYIKHQICITIERKYYKKHFAHLLKDENIL